MQIANWTANQPQAKAAYKLHQIKISNSCQAVVAPLNDGMQKLSTRRITQLSLMSGLHMLQNNQQRRCLCLRRVYTYNNIPTSICHYKGHS